MTLGFAGLEVWYPKEVCFHKEETPIGRLHWNVRQIPGHLGLFKPLSKQAKKGNKTLAGMIDPDDLEKIRLLLHSRVREEDVCNPAAPQGYHIPSCPMVKVNRRLNQQKQDNS